MPEDAERPVCDRQQAQLEMRTLQEELVSLRRLTLSLVRRVNELEARDSERADMIAVKRGTLILDERLNLVEQRLSTSNAAGVCEPQLQLRCLGSFLSHTAPVWCLASHEQFVFSGSADTSVRVWDLTTHTCRHVLEGHETVVLSITTIHNLLISGDKAGFIRIWNLGGSFPCIHAILVHSNSVPSLARCTQRNLIVTGSKQSLKVWAVRSVGKRHSFFDAPPKPTIQFEVTAQISHWVRAIVVWRDDVFAGVTDAVLVISLVSRAIRMRLTAPSSVYSLSVTPQLLVAGTASGVIAVWEHDSADLEPLSTLGVAATHSSVYAVVGLNTPHGCRVMAASQDANVRVWSLESGVSTQQLHRHTGPVTALTLTPQRGIVSAGVDFALRLWHWNT